MKNPRSRMALASSAVPSKLCTTPPLRSAAAEERISTRSEAALRQ